VRGELSSGQRELPQEATLARRTDTTLDTSRGKKKQLH